jgi:membrane protein
MDPRLARALTIGRAIVHEIRTERVTFMAGSIAYHAFVSLLPLFLLLLAVASTVGSRRLESNLLELTGAALTPGASEALVAELQRTSTGASVVGLLVLLWGTLRIFRGLDTAFSDIYESEAENTLLDQFSDAAVVFLSVGAAVLLAAAVESALPELEGGAWLLQRLLVVVGLALVFLPMYYVFPDEADITVPEVLPGVAFAAVGIATFETLFGVYLRYSGQQPRSSLLAGVLVLLTWLYITGLVVLVGVVINAVFSNRSSDVDVEPVIGGVPAHGTTASHDDHTVDRAALRDTLTRVNQQVPQATTVTLHVDDEEIALPVPDSVETDVDPSGLPYLSRSVGIELRWSGGED